MNTVLKNKEKKVKITLTEDQASTLIESLLFSSSTNIGAEWTEACCNRMVDIAIVIKDSFPDNTLTINKLTYYDDESLVNEVSQRIQQNFEIDCFQIKTLESI